MIFINTVINTETTVSWPLYPFNLCYLAAAVKNLRILLEQSFTAHVDIGRSLTPLVSTNTAISEMITAHVSLLMTTRIFSDWEKMLDFSSVVTNKTIQICSPTFGRCSWPVQASPKPAAG